MDRMSDFDGEESCERVMDFDVGQTRCRSPSACGAHVGPENKAYGSVVAQP